MSAFIVFGPIGLGPDEAQYWTWSRHLDIGYYSKPPGVAWQIFLSTSLFGQTELGVRFSAVVIGTLFALAVYHLGLKAGCNKNASCIAGIIAALTPLGIFSTFLAITDGGLILFWTLALGVLADAINQQKPVSYLFFGLLIGCGALFKWPIYLLWLIAGGVWLVYSQTRSPTILMGIIISLLGLIPTFIWNKSHEFATFKHVFTIIKGGNEGSIAPGNPLEFIGSQIALISPIIFALGCLSIFYWKKLSQALRFLAVVTVTILFIYVSYSFLKKGQGNWCLFAYPSAFVVIGEVCSHGVKRKWLEGGLVLSCLMTISIFLLPIVQKNGLFYIPWKINPFKHNLGWGNLSLALKKFNSEEEFLVADKYQNTSILSFYNPAKIQAYFFNLVGLRKNQFSYWPNPEIGKNGLFVIVENGKGLNEKMEILEIEYKKALTPYFEKVNSPVRISLFKVNGESVKEALIFRGENFLGKIPPNPEKY